MTPATTGESGRPGTATPSSTLFAFGHQPGLDGLRAVSVIVVLLYHAGFGTFRGGFLGVEVFFVVSGFLITSLLLEERESTGRVSLRAFWVRRARRLLPAFVAVVVVTAAWASLFGSDQQQSSLRRELPWSLLYANNWGQIVGDTPYFAEGASLTRHLWSLSVEEQWYLLWPLVFVLLTRRLPVDRVHRRRGLFVAGLAALSVLHMVIVARGSGALISSPFGPLDDVDRINFLYLSTTTRAGGLLIGAAAALTWRPWKSIRPTSERRRVGLEVAGGSALGILGIAFVTTNLTDGHLYQWLLPVVSISSVVLTASVVHPDARALKSLLSQRALVALGRRSYGVYLWSWPISVIVGAVDGSVAAFVAAMAVTALVSEVSFRLIETPLRRASWSLPRLVGVRPQRFVALGCVGVVVALTAFYTQVSTVDRFRGDDTSRFDPATPTVTTTTQPTQTSTTAVTDLASETDGGGTTASSSTTATTTTTSTTSTIPAPADSVRLAIVGDSTANALAVNQPDGISAVYPTIVNRSLDGCSVHDAGRIITEASFGNDFTRCRSWRDTWSRAAGEADVVLVVIGAWEVFDIEIGDTIFAFDTAAGDALFTGNLRSGLDRIVAADSRAAVLEVPCMRPIESDGSSLPPLPERGDDRRVAHVNSLIREVVDGYGPDVEFIDGPDAWCDDPEIATDTALRWDGVHVYGRGANLIYETTAPAILQLGAVPT